METQNEKLEVLIEYLDIVDRYELIDNIECDGDEFLYDNNTYRVLNQKEYDEAIENAIAEFTEKVLREIDGIDYSQFELGYYMKVDVDESACDDEVRENPESYIGESIHFDDYYIFEV